jgi:ABC-2 type transport system permease protein
MTATPEARHAGPAGLSHPALSSNPRPSPATALSATRAFAWRGALKIKHVPEQLMDATVQPVLWVLMFTYLFGGAIAGSTGDYLQFLLPGILALQTFTMIYAGVALNTDVSKGVVDRFRSLPIARPTPLLGALVGDVARFLLGATVIVVLGLVLGFRPAAGVSGVLAAISLTLVFAFGLVWLFYCIGLLMRSPTAVSNASYTALFPLIFISNVFVDPETMPAWVRAVADVNPVTHLVTATRGLMDGTATAGDIGLVLAGSAILTAVFAPLTVRMYHRKGS